MRILTHYVLRAHVGPFLFALTVLTGMMLVHTVARRFEELAGRGLAASVIAEVFGLSIPHIIALTLPMAVLVAVLYTFSQLSADNEVTALKASGVNLARLLVPLLLAAALLASGMVWFNDRVLPETNHRLKNLLVDIARKSPTLELEEQVINEIQTGDMRTRYFLQAADIEPATNRLRDVVIYDLSAPGRDRTIYADSGRMAFNRERTDLFLTLHDGWIHELDKAEPATFERLFFRQQLIRIADIGNKLERSEDSGYRSDREMSLAMLAAEVGDGRRELAAVEREAAEEALGAVKAALAGPYPSATPLREEATLRHGDTATRKQGETAMGGEDNAQADPAVSPGRPLAASEAAAPGATDRVWPVASPEPWSWGPGGGGSDELTRRTLAQLRSLEDQANVLRQKINSRRVEYHKKYAIPFACIVFVLIGAPLAIRFPRGGVGMVITVSLTVFAFYYMSLIGGEELGDDDIISPFWAMWLPNALFLLLGLWGLMHVGREASTARGGGWDDLWHSLRHVLGQPVRRLARRGG
ncbi:MAG: LptF/LptG family permease [Gemmatimonadetes bacterium]|nr:LptF/LptG family permease [Gemmatimonadota bacterium]